MCVRVVSVLGLTCRLFRLVQNCIIINIVLLLSLFVSLVYTLYTYYEVRTISWSIIYIFVFTMLCHRIRYAYGWCIFGKLCHLHCEQFSGTMWCIKWIKYNDTFCLWQYYIGKTNRKIWIICLMLHLAKVYNTLVGYTVHSQTT